MSPIPWVTTAARLVVGAVLIVAGWAKMAAPALSVQAVQAYELLPEGVAVIVGYALPIFEIVLGGLLVAGLLTPMAGLVSALLWVAFIIGIASAWARGLTIDCGCFGGGGQVAAGATRYPQEIARDVGLLALSVWVIRRPPGRFALDTVLGLGRQPNGRQPDNEEQGEPEHG